MLFYGAMMTITNVHYVAMFLVSSLMLYLLIKQKKILCDDNFGEIDDKEQQE